MIIGYFGNVRQGKTLSAVRELYKLFLQGYTIYSNTHLSFPYKPLTLEWILDIVEKESQVPDRAVFFIDEIPVWMDSRCSANKRNRIVSYFLLQTGKLGIDTDYGLILLFTAQFTHLIDKRLRSVVDIGVECRKITFKGQKYFVQEKYVYRGKDSFKTIKVFKGDDKLYRLYDTRQKILLQKTRYDKLDDGGI